MKKVLILAYDFPPHNTIGGQRPYSWYLYFKELGIEPIIVTRHWDIDINGPEDCYLPSLNRNVTVEKSELGTIIRAPFTPLQRDRLIGQTGVIINLLRKISLLKNHFESIKSFSNEETSVFIGSYALG